MWLSQDRAANGHVAPRLSRRVADRRARDNGDVLHAAQLKPIEFDPWGLPTGDPEPTRQKLLDHRQLAVHSHDVRQEFRRRAGCSVGQRMTGDPMAIESVRWLALRWLASFRPTGGVVWAR